MLTILALAVAALQAAPERGEHTQHLTKCAAVCAGCQLVCDSCFKHCVDLAGDGKKEHAETAQFCVDCAECCKACASSAPGKARSLALCLNAVLRAANSAQSLARSTRMTTIWRNVLRSAGTVRTSAGTQRRGSAKALNLLLALGRPPVGNGRPFFR